MLSFYHQSRLTVCDFPLGNVMRQSIFSTSLLLLILLVAGGCSEPVVDGTSDVSMRASIDQIRASLPKRKEKKFQEALVLILVASSQAKVDGEFTDSAIDSAIGSAIHSTIDNANVDSNVSSLRSVLDGKTASEIIKEAETVRIETEARAKNEHFSE